MATCVCTAASATPKSAANLRPPATHSCTSAKRATGPSTEENRPAHSDQRAAAPQSCALAEPARRWLPQTIPLSSSVDDGDDVVVYRAGLGLAGRATEGERAGVGEWGQYDADPLIAERELSANGG